jgi:hypothetical protein
VDVVGEEGAMVAEEAFEEGPEEAVALGGLVEVALGDEGGDEIQEGDEGGGLPLGEGDSVVAAGDRMANLLVKQRQDVFLKVMQFNLHVISDSVLQGGVLETI